MKRSLEFFKTIIYLSVGLDVFNGHYFGNYQKLIGLLTAHLGPMSLLSRSEMESQATEEAIRFIKEKIYLI